MTQLTDKLIAVLLPEDAYDFDLKIKFLKYKFLENNQINILKDFKYSKNSYKILGTVTKDNIDFDCEKYVEKCLNSFSYINYKSKNQPSVFRTKKESFISLLNSKGLFLDKLDNQKILILEKIKD